MNNKDKENLLNAYRSIYIKEEVETQQPEDASEEESEEGSENTSEETEESSSDVDVATEEYKG